MSESNLKPSIEHYRGIIRLIVGAGLISLVFYLRDYTDIPYLSDILSQRSDSLNHRNGLTNTFEITITLVMGIVCALGLDKALVPFLKPLSNKPQIEIITDGIRYLYTNAKADILFSDIEKVIARVEPEPSIEIITIAGQFIEIKEFTNMDNLIEHLKHGNVQFEQSDK